MKLKFAKIVAGNFVLLYLLAICSDAFLKAESRSKTTRPKEAIETEEAIRIKSNKAFRKLSSAGVVPTFYPGDAPDFSVALGEKLNYLPLGSFPSKEQSLCDEGYGMITYKSDKLGFRNPTHAWNNLDGNHIILFGNSYAHGSCVEDAFLVSTLLNKNLDKTDHHVVNAASGSDHPEIYRHKLDALAFNNNININTPAAIVILFTNWDLHGLHLKSPFQSLTTRSSDISMKSVTAAGQNGIKLSENGKKFFESLESEWSLNPLIASPEEDTKKSHSSSGFIHKFLLDASSHMQLLEIRSRIYQLRSQAKNKSNSSLANVASSLNSLRYAIDKCSSASPSCKVIAAYIPNSEYWRPGGSELGYVFSKEVNRLKKNNYNFAFVDLTKPIRDLGLSAYAPAGGHLSKRGYALVAQKINEAINLQVAEINK